MIPAALLFLTVVVNCPAGTVPQTLFSCKPAQFDLGRQATLKGIGLAGDLLTTHRLESQGGHELMPFPWSQTTPRRIVAGVVIEGGSLLAERALHNRRHRNWAKAARWVPRILRIAAVVNNTWRCVR